MNRKKVFLVKSAKSVVGGVALGSVWSVARWYASDPVFAPAVGRPFSLDWFGVWSFGAMTGFAVVAVVAGVVFGCFSWVRWMMEVPDEEQD